MEHFEIAKTAERSADFRRVLWTGEHTQLVIMTIPPDGEIGEETHDENDQILSFVSGLGKAVVDGKTKKVGPGDVVIALGAGDVNQAVRGLKSRLERKLGVPPAPSSEPGSEVPQ